MIRNYIIFCSILLLSCSSDKEPVITVNQPHMRWWYDTPATKYWEGMPIGTGRFGAMIPGALGHEVIAFNDETLWTGGPYNPNKPQGPEILKELRKLIFAGKYAEAQELGWQMNSTPQHVQFYQPMGRLNLYYGHDTLTTHYKRTLDMDNATVDVSYQHKGIRYERKIFASYPDQAVIIRLTADKPGSISFSSELTSLQPNIQKWIEGNELVMSGSTIDSKPGMASRDSGGKYTILSPKMHWQSKVKILNEGGTVSKDEDKLIVSGANAVTLILAGATNWVSWNDVSANEKQRCNEYISKAAQHPYPELLQRHLDDYCPRFAACKLNLGEDPTPQFTTTQAMEAIRQGANDPAYEARYFQFGRYLMLAGAREGTLAFNNHNMWLDNLEGRWQGRWTLNINLQQCYWCVESTHLPRINESLLLFVENLAQAGARTARELFGCRGWCSCLGTDVWFNTAPTDGNPQHSFYPVSGLWLMQQLYDHYLYDPDKTYLHQIYPLMKGAAEFITEFIVKDPNTGYMLTCPASSPENSFLDKAGKRVSLSAGSTGDTEIVRNFLRNFIKASEQEKTDADLREKASNILSQLPPYQIGQFGQLQEWLYDFPEFEITHRHLSHLWAAYPDDDITIRKNPKLAEAVRVAIQRRGNINMGWSGAWKINLHARLEEPEEGYQILHKMLTDISIHPREEDSQITPSFEGNQAIQGITAGMTEMMLQSHSGEISLLPALPSEWSQGEISGLRARGGYEIDMSWKNNVLSQALLKSKYQSTCRLRTKVPVRVYSRGKKLNYIYLEDYLIEFPVQPNGIYQIVPIP